MMRVFKDYSPRMREPAVAVQILAATMLLSIISFGIYMSSPDLIARPLLWTFWFAGFMIAAWWCPHIAGRNLLIGFGPDLMLLSATLILPERGLLWLLIMCALTFHYFIWSKSVRRALLGISSTMVAALPGWIISESIGGGSPPSTGRRTSTPYPPCHCCCCSASPSRRSAYVWRP
ncbi:MAG: hypothetical protein ACTMHZ_07125 [Bifidobacterium psychraerophilum]